MRCIELFIYKNENEHFRVRNEIANYLLTNYRQLENINIHTEVGDKYILDYINYIRLSGKWSVHIEYYATNIFYNINAYNLYKHFDNQYNTLYYKFAYKFCNDNNYQKDLCLITNYVNSHYLLLFSKKHHTIKINNILLLNQPLLNINHKKIKIKL